MKFFYLFVLPISAAAVLAPLLWIQPTGLRLDKSQGLPDEPIVRRDVYSADVKSIDPATCGDTTSASVQANFYEGLYTYQYLLRPVEVIPLLASSMPEISSDSLTYTIHIKPGVLYHRNPCFGADSSGRPGTREVRAEDFVLAMKRCADYHIATGLSFAFLSGNIDGLDAWRRKSEGYAPGDFSRYDLPVSGLQAVDPLTLRIKLTRPFPQFQYVLAESVYAPIPREAINYWLAGEGPGRTPVPMKERSTEFTEDRQVVGTGPYLLQKFERKKQIVLVRNPDFRPDYYPSEGTPQDKAAGLLDDAGKPVPFIDVLSYQWVAEDYSAWMLFLTHQSDASGVPRELYQSVISPSKDLEATWQQRHIVLNKYTVPAVYWIAFNVQDPVLAASKSLREAMCLCFDVETYISILFNGRGIRAVNIVPSSFDVWAPAGPGPYYHFDVEAARAKLDQAKQELAAAGLLADGKIPQLVLDLGDRGTEAKREGEFAQQQFARIGLNVRVEYNDWPTLQEKVQNKNVQLYAMGWHADYPDAENFLQLFYSPNIAKGTNNTNYSNPQFDRLYEQAVVMPSSPQRTELYVQMIRMISDDVPVLLLSEPLSYVLDYQWLQNVKAHPFGYGYAKYQRIDVDMRRRLTGE